MVVSYEEIFNFIESIYWCKKYGIVRVDNINISSESITIEGEMFWL